MTITKGDHFDDSEFVSNTEKPLFEIDIGQEVGVFRPRSVAELRKWFETERNFWLWVSQQPAANVPEIQRQRSNDDNLLSTITQAQNFLDSKDQQNFTRAIEQIRNMLAQRYGQMHLLHSQSPRSQYLASISDKYVAAYLLRYFLGLTVSSPGNPIELSGFVAGIAFDLDIAQTRSESITATTLDRLNQIGVEHEALRTQAGRLQDQYTDVAAHIAALFEQQRRQYDEAHATRDTDFRELVRKITAELETLKSESAEKLNAIGETYDKKLALQSAVTYLDGKASSHRIAAIITGIVSLIAGVGFTGFAFWLGTTLLAGDKPAWNRVAVAALAATLCFWFLRILVRMFLSNLHLTSDTRSRSTLMQTYLALLREGGGLKDDDRELILKILFRPFSDGMVRDDAAPPSLWDVASRVVGGK